jgi:hypothetical protein
MPTRLKFHCNSYVQSSMKLAESSSARLRIIDDQDPHRYRTLRDIDRQYRMSRYSQPCRPSQLSPVSKNGARDEAGSRTDPREHNRHLLPDSCGQLDSRIEHLD